MTLLLNPAGFRPLQGLTIQNRYSCPHRDWSDRCTGVFSCLTKPVENSVPRLPIPESARTLRCQSYSRSERRCPRCSLHRLRCHCCSSLPQSSSRGRTPLHHRTAAAAAECLTWLKPLVHVGRPELKLKLRGFTASGRLWEVR